MLIGEIEGKNARRELKVFKGCIIWLILSIVVSILCVPFTIYEMFYTQHFFSMIGYLIASPLYPILIMALTYEQMKRAPARIKLQSNQIVFQYQLGLKTKEKTMLWGNIIEIVPFDLIKDNTGQEIRLPLLKSEDMDLILETAEDPEYLDIENIWEVSNLDKALMDRKKEPNESTVVSKRTWSSLVFVLLYGIIFVPLTILTGYLLVDRIITSDFSGIWMVIIFFILFGFPSLLVPFGIVDSIRKKEFIIDRKGARMRKGKGIKYDFKWDEVDMIYNYAGRYSRDMIFRLKSGKRKGISNNDFDIKEIKEAYGLAKEYCAYHRIPMDNKLGW